MNSFVLKPRFISFYIKRFLSSDKEFLNELHRLTKLYPTNEKLYKLAFIHRSASLRLQDGTFINNERLEFLGDAILDSIVAEYLYKNFPNEPEGFLTKTRSKIVNGESLAHLATTMGIDKFIVSHVSHFDTNKNILGDAFEAMIGALYLDQGYKSVKKFVINRLINKYINIDEVLKTDTNYKSKLLEWSQQNKKQLVFNTIPIDNGNHAPYFSSEVVINGEVLASGFGSSKKEAEQNAARLAVNSLS